MTDEIVVFRALCGICNMCGAGAVVFIAAVCAYELREIIDRGFVDMALTDVYAGELVFVHIFADNLCGKVSDLAYHSARVVLGQI